MQILSHSFLLGETAIASVCVCFLRAHSQAPRQGDSIILIVIESTQLTIGVIVSMSDC